MGAGLLVQFGDQVADWGEHDRVQPTATVGAPCLEQVLGECGKGADVDALSVEVEAQRLRLSVSQRQGCGGFGGVLKSVQLGEPDRAVAGLDVAQHTAGTDRGQLLIITDQPHTAAATDDELDGGVEGEGVGHPCFIYQHQG